MTNVTIIDAQVHGPALPPGVTNAMAISEAAMLAVFAMIYPVALLIVLHTRKVKKYFKGLGGSVAT